MTFVALHADRLVTVVAADPLVPARDVGTVYDAAGLLAEAGRLRAAAEATIEAARETARADGFAQGEAAGRAAGEVATSEALARLEAAAVARDTARQADVARLAVEVLRRIAGELGDAAVIAGLAQRAAAALPAEIGATVRVPPAVVDDVRARLAPHAALTVEADAALDGTACVLETPLGRTHAGLETQLAAIGRAWSGG